MDEEPHAHERLVAKPRRQSGNSSNGSEVNLTGNDSQIPVLNDEQIPGDKSTLRTGSSSSGSDGNLTGSGEQFPVLGNEQISGSVETTDNLRASVRSFLLEPMILILLFAYNFSCKIRNSSSSWNVHIYLCIPATILKSQITYQSCTVGFGYPDEVCKLLGTKNPSNETKRIDAEVQPYAAQVFLTIKLVECIIPAFCGLFIGAWADRYGRKPLLMASYLGKLEDLIAECWVDSKTLIDISKFVFIVYIHLHYSEV